MKNFKLFIWPIACIIFSGILFHLYDSSLWQLIFFLPAAGAIYLAVTNDEDPPEDSRYTWIVILSIATILLTGLVGAGIKGVL